MSNNFSNSAKNASISFLCQSFALLLGFVARTVFIRFLSVEYLGVSGLFANILTILSLTELGIGNVMVYSLYEPLKKQNYGRIRALLNLYQKAYRLIALTIFLLGCILTPFIEHLIKTVPNIPENIYLLFLLYLFNTVASYLCIYKKSILLADQKNYIANLATSISQIILVTSQILVLFIFKSFIGYLICNIVCTLSLNIILTYIVNKQYKEVLQSPSDVLTKEDKQTLFHNVKALAISKISGVVSNGTDNIIISKMFGLTPVGLVSNYTMLMNAVNGIFYNAFSDISSSIGNFNVDSDLETKREIFDELFLLVYLVYSFVCVCILVMTQLFITQWIGAEFLVSFPVLLNLVLGIYVSGVNYPIYSFRTTMGYFKQVQYVYVACAVCNVGLSVLFGLWWGVAGVFAATWVSKLLLPEIGDSYYTYKVILKRKLCGYFFKYLLFVIGCAINAGICWYVVSQIHIVGWIGLFIKAAVCGITNILLNLAVFYRTHTFKQIMERVRNLIRRKIKWLPRF